MSNNHYDQSIVTLGVFDGLHKGHMSILYFIKQTNYKQKIVLILHPHPRKILENIDVKYIIPLNLRILMLKQNGFEDVFVIKFNKELSQISGEEFIKNFLIKQYNCKHFVVGFNAHFGKGRDVTPDLLVKIAKNYGIKVTICEGVSYQDAYISSTRIRKAIKEGNLYDAMQMLGRPFFIEGDVVKGGRLGREIGFPTLNIQYDQEQILPPVGVYFGYVKVLQVRQIAMINLGFKPTVKENISMPILEAHVIDAELTDNISRAQIEFVEKIRDEKRFDSIAQLKQQLEKDKNYVLQNYQHFKLRS